MSNYGKQLTITTGVIRGHRGGVEVHHLEFNEVFD